LRIEPLLEAPHTLKIVETLTSSVQQNTELVPQRSNERLADPRQRRHAEVEPAPAGILSPEHELSEQIAHRARRCRRIEAHEIHLELVVTAGRPDRREGDDRTIPAHDGDGIS